MNSSIETLMTAKSAEELDNYLINIKKYTPDAIKAAVSELQKRGRQFSDKEMENIDLIIQEKLEIEKKEGEVSRTNQWSKNIVTDENAPEYFSHRAIWAFSTFFTVIFGAVLLSFNLKGNKKARWTVIGYGIIYTVIAIIILNQIERNTVLTFTVNGLGGALMTSFFWNKYIGKDTKYRTKSIWKPLIISIVISIPFILAALLVDAVK